MEVNVGNAGTIAVIVEEMAQFVSGDIIEGVTCRLEDFGYKAFLMNLRLYSRWSDKWFDNEAIVDELLASYLRDIESMHFDGIIYVAAHARNINKIPESIGIPAVMIYANELNPAVPSVMLDDEVSAFKAVKYLIDKGHRRISIAAGEPDNIHTMARVKGVLKALEQIGVSEAEARITYAGWVRKSGYRAGSELLQDDTTAVFCMADRVAGGFYRYLEERGLKAGKDISVIGFDNQELGDFLNPALTTMALPLRMMGNTAVRLLMSMIKDGRQITGEEHITRIPCTLIEKDSVAYRNPDD